MMKTKYRIVFLLILVGSVFATFAQPTKNWDQEKIMARRYVIHERFQGSPYLTDDWVHGEVTFSSGETQGDLPIKYDGYIDELISFNKLYSTMILIEKSTIKSFEFSFQGKDYYFERRYFNSLLKKGDRFFQVYHKGDVDLLCFREVKLSTTSLYWDTSGNMKNKEYKATPRFFLYKKGEGYHWTNLKKKSLIKYFSGKQRKQVNQLMRKNHVHFKSPEEFANALSILEVNNIDLEF